MTRFESLFRTAIAISAGLVIATTSQHVMAGTPAPVDKAAVEKIVHDYLMDHPEALRAALDNMQISEQKVENEAATNKVKGLRNQIYGVKGDAETGNPKAAVEMAYFFDYQCGYCKRMTETNRSMFTHDGPVRVIMKDLPILGPDSVTAAKAALAAKKQGKYEQLHYLLMDLHGPINEDRIMTLAATLGMDQERLKKDMADPAIERELAEHRRLAQNLGINGTPAYVIEDTLIPGAISADDMRKVIAEAAAQKTNKK